jgi:acetylglutamate kinase
MKPIVIKFGGDIVESEVDLDNLAYSLKELHKLGEKIILVHGGGPFASSLSKRLDLVPNMVGGRRVTCVDTLEVMKMTLPGVVNSNILGKLIQFGLPGVSVSGISIVDAHKRPPKIVSGSEGKKVDFGFVGDVDGVRAKLLNDLLNSDHLPVVSPLSFDGEGMFLNINADTIAVSIARSVGAKKLVLVTKVGGVFKDIEDPSSKFKLLTVTKAKKLIEENIIQGGMIPKLEEGFKLIKEQLDEFHIVGTSKNDEILSELKDPGSRGTAITRG